MAQSQSDQNQTETEPLSELTGFQRDLLTVLSRLDGPSGQRLKAALQEEGYAEIKHGRLYANLDTLVEDGYVVKGSIDQRTNSYRLTDAGREAVREDLRWRVGEVEL